MAYPPTEDDFKAQFTREFVYGAIPSTVMDSDITRAINETAGVFNRNLWSTDAEASIAYLYASAHFLALNIQSAGGLSLQKSGEGVNSVGEGTVNSKSVGGISISQQFPESVVSNPMLHGFTLTGFGCRYLQMLTPRLVGALFVVNNRTGAYSGTEDDI